jgi:hypothetical protein
MQNRTRADRQLALNRVAIEKLFLLKSAKTKLHQDDL